MDKQLKGLLDGTLDPKDVRHVDNLWAYTAGKAGADKPAEAKGTVDKLTQKQIADEEERRKSLELQRKWDEERALREAKDERDRWWRFARMQYGDDGVNTQEDATNGEGHVKASKQSAEARRRMYGAIDYSWWDKWVQSPDDAVSVAEREREARERERAQDEAFEKANPDFVAMFKSDQDKRAEAEAKKQRKAEMLKDAGNAAYKKGDYRSALNQYVEAIKVSPFTVAALNNMSMVYLALGNTEQTIEFANRVIFIEKYGSAAATKALFRRGSAHRSAGRFEQAEQDLALAQMHDPSNSEVAKELAAVRIELAEKGKEDKLLDASGGSTSNRSEASTLCDRLLAQCKSVGSASEAASSASVVTLQKDELATLATAMTGSHAVAEDTRVYYRASGLLEAVHGSMSRTLHSCMRGGTDASNEQHSFPLFSVQTATYALIAVASSVENPKNRLLVIQDGLVQALLDVLSAMDEALISNSCAAGCLISNKSKESLAADVAAFIDAGLLLVLTCISPAAPPACRAIVAGHPFFTGVHTTGAGTNATDLSLQQRTDLIGRLHGYAVLMASELVVPHIVLASAHSCVQILQQACLPDTAQQPTSTTAKGKGSSFTQTDAATQALRQTVTAAVDGFASARTCGPIPSHPVTVLLQLITVLIGRSLFDPALLTGSLMAAATLTLSGLSARETLRPAFAAPAVSVINDGSGSSGSNNVTQASSAATQRMAKYTSSARSNARRSPNAPVTTAEAPGNNSTGAPSSTEVPSALHPLLDLLRLPVVPSPDEARHTGSSTVSQWDAIRGTALAAMANACISAGSTQNGVLAALAKAGAVDILLGFLGDKQTVPLPAAPGRGQSQATTEVPLPADLRARAALILGRLASEPAASASLAGPGLITTITALLRGSVESVMPAEGTKVSVTATTCPPAEATYQDGLIKLLAVSVQGSAAAVDALVAAGGIPAVVGTLRLAVPTLPSVGGAVSSGRVVGVGNACSIAIAVAGQAQHVRTMVEAGAVEILVDALRSPCGDDAGGPGGIVRKNAMVALARLSKDVKGHERLAASRGLEIIMQLGRKTAGLA